MKLYSYVVARDHGFAPNPFCGVCTLATCKPQIRKAAKVGDWIVGTGSQVYQLAGHLVFAMKISEILTYDEYWCDPRFQNKKPNLRASEMLAYGDNIYHQDPEIKQWIQENSHHSHKDGSPNDENIVHDTGTSTNVLVGSDFVYFGGFGPAIPEEVRYFQGEDICHQHPGHKCRFPGELIDSFVKWIGSIQERGYSGAPAAWKD